MLWLTMACMPIFGHTFFGPIGLIIFMGTQDTIIYQLVVRNSSYDADAYTFYMSHYINVLQVYSPGDYVCRKGDIGREMFIVKQGTRV